MDDPVRLTCAGRTDAGVHARGQVAHVDLADDADGDFLRRRLQRLLPRDIQLRALAAAPAGFDARFSALDRRYVYRLSDFPEGPDPLLRSHIAHHRRPLDVTAMNVAAHDLLGEHDFAAFCKPRDGATTVRTLRSFSTSRTAEGLLETTIVADAFCHSMVRALMGAITAVGAHTRDPAWAAAVLDAAVRDPHVQVMPACGLTLEEVRYPPDGELEAQARRSRRRRDQPAEDGRREANLQE